jgi:hypothetical protein
MEKVVESIPDPTGLAYMYCLPTSLLRGKKLKS